MNQLVHGPASPAAPEDGAPFLGFRGTTRSAGVVVVSHLLLDLVWAWVGSDQESFPHSVEKRVHLMKAESRIHRLGSLQQPGTEHVGPRQPQDQNTWTL